MDSKQRNITGVPEKIEQLALKKSYKLQPMCRILSTRIMERPYYPLDLRIRNYHNSGKGTETDTMVP